MLNFKEKTHPSSIKSELSKVAIQSVLHTAVNTLGLVAATAAVCVILFKPTQELGNSELPTVSDFLEPEEVIKNIAGEITRTTENSPVTAMVDAKEFCKMDENCLKLAEVIVFEARGEPESGRILVGSVVLNRVNNKKRWGNSIKAVVHEPRQFSYISDKHKQKKPTQKDWDSALNLSAELLYLDGHNNKEITHYHANTVNPKWANKLELVAQVGNHLFYK